MYDLYLKMEPYFDYSIIEELKLEENNYVVCTMHRDFNVDNPENLKIILKELRKISKRLPVVFPIHPRTRNRVKEFGFENLLDKIAVIEPVDYLKMMGLVKKCKLVITDSGGLQKEAYFSGKRAIVVMPDTGWRELIEIGWNVLSDPEDIYENFLKMEKRESREIPPDMYGEGNASTVITDVMVS